MGFFFEHLMVLTFTSNDKQLIYRMTHADIETAAKQNTAAFSNSRVNYLLCVRQLSTANK